MALSSKEKLFADLAANGWVQDPRAKKPRSRYESDVKVPDRNIHVHDAGHGGQWRISLKWTNSGSSWSPREGDRLLKVHVYYVAPDQEFRTTESGYDSTEYQIIGTLENSDSSGYKHSFLWDALKWTGKDGTVGPYRKAVDVLIKNPDQAIWVALEEKHRQALKYAQDQERDRLERLARKRPLPITVSQKSENYGYSEWKKLTVALTSAAKRIDYADGTSNLPQLVAEAQKALSDVTDVLNSSAMEDMHRIFDDLVSA